MTVATRSTDECRASEISASEPIAMPTTNFAAAMPALAKIEIAATEDLTEWGLLMRGGVAGRGEGSKRGSETQSLLIRRSNVLRIVLNLNSGAGLGERTVMASEAIRPCSPDERSDIRGGVRVVPGFRCA